MKNLKYVFSLIVIVMLTISCERETEQAVDETNLIVSVNPETNLEARIDQFLEDLKPQMQVRSQELGSFEAISFELVINYDTGAITAENIQATPFFPIDHPDRYRSTVYTIECEGGEGDWPQTCTGVVSCAKLVKKCLDSGGCATVCQNKATENIRSVSITYVP